MKINSHWCSRIKIFNSFGFYDFVGFDDSGETKEYLELPALPDTDEDDSSGDEVPFKPPSRIRFSKQPIKVEIYLL